MTDKEHPEPDPTILKPGTPAPDFELETSEGRAVTLDQLRGSPAILAFYPADFSPVCSDQMALYNEILPIFEQHGAQLVGISVDSKWAHRAFARERNLHFPLLSDFEPKGEVAREYGVYDFEKGRAARAIFVLDSNGVIVWSHLASQGKNPGADGILKALEGLPAGQKTRQGSHA
jgi:peroxiredoxin